MPPGGLEPPTRCLEGLPPEQWCVSRFPVQSGSWLTRGGYAAGHIGPDPAGVGQFRARVAPRNPTWREGEELAIGWRSNRFLGCGRLADAVSASWSSDLRECDRDRRSIPRARGQQLRRAQAAQELSWVQATQGECRHDGQGQGGVAADKRLQVFSAVTATRPGGCEGRPGGTGTCDWKPAQRSDRSRCLQRRFRTPDRRRDQRRVDLLRSTPRVEARR